MQTFGLSIKTYPNNLLEPHKLSHDKRKKLLSEYTQYNRNL